MYLVDTDVVVEWLGGREPTLSVLDDLRRSEIAISIVSHVEIREGVINARDRRAAEQGYRRFLRGTRVLVLSRPVAERAAEIRADLRRRGLPVGTRTMDLLIAATAVEHDLELVTRNARHFRDIPELRVRALS